MGAKVKVTTVDQDDRVKVTVRGGGFDTTRVHVKTKGNTRHHFLAADRTVKDLMPGQHALETGTTGNGYNFEVV